MNLYIIRHAIAEDLVPGSDKSDTERALTPRGRKRFKHMVEALDQRELRFAKIYTSPWRRSVETANLLSSLCKQDPLPTPYLARSPSQTLLDVLKSDNHETVAVVGHVPWVNQLAAWLMCGDPHLEDRFVLKKGSVLWLEGALRPGAMALRGLWSCGDFDSE